MVHTALVGTLGSLLLAGCAAGTRQSASTVPEPATASTVAARSVWGVVPEAPQREADIGPELIRGSAVAVSENTLLANCRVVGNRDRVGLVRQNSFQVATLVARDAEGQVCALRVARGQLLPAPAFRGLDDLRPGEPVLAFTNVTATDLALTRGWLASVSAEPDPFLETTVVLPDDALSGVLFDAQGDLIGLGSAGPTPDAFALAAPIADPLAPRLARNEIGASETVQASLESDPRDAAPPPPLWLTLDSGGDGDGGQLTNRPLVRTERARNVRAVATPAAAPGNLAPASVAAGTVASTTTGVSVDDDDLAEAAARGAFSRSDRSRAAGEAEDASVSSRGRSTRSLSDDVRGREAEAEEGDDRDRGREGERGSVASGGGQNVGGDDAAGSGDARGSDDSTDNAGSGSGRTGGDDDDGGQDSGAGDEGDAGGGTSGGGGSNAGSGSGADDGGTSGSGDDSGDGGGDASGGDDSSGDSDSDGGGDSDSGGGGDSGGDSDGGGGSSGGGGSGGGGGSSGGGGGGSSGGDD